MAVSAAFLAACSTSQPKGMVNTSAPKRSKEYFAESEYGVKASPRVTDKRTRLPRGGGRDLVGKPYKIKGKWYKPKEDRGYSKVGAASWYGDAFHGRLTANGEIYDMTHLTAAHPTMPLPSYARVTNMKNGASIIVRVNDRGPYANGRIIDLSKRAAELLDYSHTGVAKVKVDYVGRAPLHGDDDQYLMASYRPNGVRAPAPEYDDGLPTGVMIAMGGTTPSAAVGTTVASVFPAFGTSRRAAAAAPAIAVPSVDPTVVMPAAYETNIGGTYPMLPDYGPIVPERPSDEFLYPTQTAFAVMSYADQRVEAASDPFDLVVREGMTSTDVVASWTRRQDVAAPDGDYVLAGSFENLADAERVAQAMLPFGVAMVETETGEGNASFTVTVQPRDGTGVDAVLVAAWEHGAPDAFVVRR